MSNNNRPRTGPKKESILELAKWVDSSVRVKCLGGRELKGILRGYDELVNLVIDECEEYLRGTFHIILQSTHWTVIYTMTPSSLMMMMIYDNNHHPQYSILTCDFWKKMQFQIHEQV